MTILSVIGARPQIVKAAAVSRAIRLRHREVLVHTGQHYDRNMSQVFFDELTIPEPDINLGIGSGPHGAQTGAMLGGLERVAQQVRPDWVLVYGDTNSTLAGALAAAKLGIPVAHVEAGLRSFNRAMPEEVNRILTDHLSALLLCPSRVAVENLASEGITHGVREVGDVMLDAFEPALERSRRSSQILERLSLEAGTFVLATIHRAENTDDRDRLLGILRGLSSSNQRVVFPVHPRTRKLLHKEGADLGPSILCIDPVGYLDMLRLEDTAGVIVTDSGGMQKEAYWLGVPCVTVRDETEWVETTATGWNVLAGADPQRITQAIASAARPSTRPPIYGTSGAAARCVAAIEAVGRSLNWRQRVGATGAERHAVLQMPRST